MSSIALGADPFKPRPPQGMRRGLAFALVAHALLIAALAFGVNWRASEPTAVVAELWSSVPQFAAPRAVEAPPPPPSPPPRAAAPVLTAPAATPPRPAPDAQIAIEKAAQVKQQRIAAELERERDKQLQREKELEREKERAKADKTKRDTADRKAADDAKAQAVQSAQQAAAREAYQRRMNALAGATGAPIDTGSALRSSAPSAGYAGRIMARIKPNIVLTDPVDGNPLASVEVKLAPDGTIVSKRLVKASGVKAWDDAVLRAIDRTEILPRDTDGRVPPVIQIDFKPRE